MAFRPAARLPGGTRSHAVLFWVDHRSMTEATYDLTPSIPSICRIFWPSTVVRGFFLYRELRISPSSTRSLWNQISLFSCTSSPSSNPLSAQNSRHSFSFGSYALFVFFGRDSRACSRARRQWAKSSALRATQRSAAPAAVFAGREGPLTVAEGAGVLWKLWKAPSPWPRLVRRRRMVSGQVA